VLHSSYKLAHAYDEESFQELCSHSRVTPSHALQLANVADSDFRSELEARVIGEGMSVRDMEREIRAKYGQRRKPGAGRPLKKSKTVTAAVRHATEQAKLFVKHCDQVWFGDEFSIPDEVETIPGDKLSEEFENQISEAADLFTQLAKTATRNAEALRGTLKKVEARRQAQAEAEAKVLAEAAEVEAMMDAAA